MEQPSRPVGELSERLLLQQLQRLCPPEALADDAAVLALERDRWLTVTTDTLVEGVHFSERTTQPEDAGWRAAAANLSDLAAMGAAPLGLTVGLQLPRDTALDWVERFYSGFNACLQPHGAGIVGGDLSRAPAIAAAVTALGSVAPQHLLRRSQASAGDAIVASGYHGCARAGLELLLNPEQGDHLGASERAELVQAHQRPQPRLDALAAIAAVSAETSVAGTDSSDGLAEAVLQLCQASDVGATLEREALPISAALARFVGLERSQQWCLYGGEDFELVLCLPSASARWLLPQLGAGAAIVGRITAERSVALADRAGNQQALGAGYQHF